MCTTTVIGVAQDNHGREVGTYNPGPVLDTRIYEVMFPDGKVEQYVVNLIAEMFLRRGR